MNRQKPTRFPYSCHAQFGMSGIGEPPAGGVRTVRGIVSRGFHSSTLTITQTASRAPPGNASLGRAMMDEYAIRSWGSIVGPPVILGRCGGPAAELAFCLNLRWQKSTNREETNAARESAVLLVLFHSSVFLRFRFLDHDAAGFQDPTDIFPVRNCREGA